MKLAANMITIDDPITVGDLALRRRNNSTLRKKSQFRAAQESMSRNERRARNFSAHLPLIDRPRYEEERGATETNILNFVKASKRQMRDAIGQQQPLARRFYEEGLAGPENQPKLATKLNPQEIANFSNSQIGAARPSVQSVQNSLNRKLELNLSKLESEQSDFASIQKIKRPVKVDNLTGQVNIKGAFLSPRGSVQHQSKVSIASDSFNVGTGAGHTGPVSVRTSNQHSPKSTSFGRDLKHINKYLDAREMQIRSQLENTQKLDSKLQHNKDLKELFHQVMGQVRSKLPGSGSTALSDIVKRIMDGLGECFQLQETSFAKKVEIRNKKIEALQNELEVVKENYAKFKRESTVDAFFKKHTDIVDRTGRSAKDYMKDLNRAVDDYLESTDAESTKKDEAERQVAKEAEPSGADSLLIQLQIMSRNLDVPAPSDNPLSQFDLEKDRVMQDFKRSLTREATSMRGLVETHVKGQLGLVKPTKETGSQTLTFSTIKSGIISQFRYDLEQKFEQQNTEKFNIKKARWEREIKIVEEKNANLKQKLSQLSNKLTTMDGETYVNSIREKIIAFFNIKLGDKSKQILKEFNEKVMDVKNTEVSVTRIIRQISSFQQEQIEMNRQTIANQYNGIIKQAEIRHKELMSRAQSLERTLASQSQKSEGNLNSPIRPSATATNESKITERDLRKMMGEVVDVDEPKEEKKSPPGTSKKEPAKTTKKKNSRSNVLSRHSGTSQRSNGHSPRQPDKSKAKSSPRKGSAASRSSKNSSRNNQESKPSDEQCKIVFTQVGPDDTDDRKKLMVKFNGIRNIMKDVEDFQWQPELTQGVKQAEVVIKKLNRLQSQTEIVHRIIEFNSKDASMVGEASVIKSAVNEMTDDIDKLQSTINQSKKGIEAHKLFQKVKDFYREARFKKKKENMLPVREEIMDNISHFENITKLIKELPSKDQVDFITFVNKHSDNMEKKMTALIERKIQSPPEPAPMELNLKEQQQSAATINPHQRQILDIQKQLSEVKSDKKSIAETVEYQKQLSQQLEQLQSEHISNQIEEKHNTPVKSMEDPKDVAKELTLNDTIQGVRMARSHIESNFSELLNSEFLTQPKLLEKVQSMVSNLERAAEWLEQRQLDPNAQLSISEYEDESQMPSTTGKKTSTPKVRRQDSESQDKRSNVSVISKHSKPAESPTRIQSQEQKRSLLQKVVQNNPITDQNVVNPPPSPPPVPESSSRVQDLGLISEVNDATVEDEEATEATQDIKEQSQKSDDDLQANEIEINDEDTKREGKLLNIQQKVPKKKHSLATIEKTDLGQIGEEDTDGGEVDDSKQVVHDRRSSRIEVFRKTPNKFDQSQSGHEEYSESSPKINLVRDQQQDRNQGSLFERQQFADISIEQAEQTFTFAANGKNGKPPLVDKKDERKIINNQTRTGGLRNSQETDYLATASIFEGESFRHDQNRINVGITNHGPNLNETSNFLNRLKDQVGIESRPGAKNTYPKHSVKQEIPRDSQTQSPSMELNKDLQNTHENIKGSQASSIVEPDIYIDTPLQPTQKRPKPNPSTIFKQKEVKMPSSLKITQKPVHGHLRMDDLDHEQKEQLLNSKSQKPVSTVLMLTQSTQTENRALLKELLTMINETIMKQLEQQSSQMDQTEFQEQVSLLKEAIPAVYDQVKRQSDTFFIEKVLGPKFTTANINEISDVTKQQQQPQPIVPASNDLAHLIQKEKDPVQMQATGQTVQTQSTGIAQLAIEKKFLTPSASVNSLHRDASTKQLYDNVAKSEILTQSQSQEQLNVDPSQKSLIQKKSVKKQPFLSLGDFSRYGSHTLEISQEVRTRVNLRQVGAAGGGFIGRAVKIPAPRPEQQFQ